MTEQGHKKDDGKPWMDLLDWRFVEAVQRGEVSNTLDVALLQCQLNQGGFGKERIAMAARQLLPTPWSWEAVARVMMYGAKKYERDQWRAGMAVEKVLAAVGRHVYLQNPDLPDEETGLPHWAHAVCELMFLWVFLADNTVKPDDRVLP